MQRGLSPTEWDRLPQRDLDAIAWWQFVERHGWKPMSKDQFAQLPVKGGVRARALAQEEQARTILFPPDPED